MIPISTPSLGEEELSNVTDAVSSGWISSQGKFIPEFEDMFAQYCGTRYGIATSSGTTALHLALVALGIGPGDEVIVPTLTFIATANAVTYTGAKPVFVDSTSDYWGIDPEKIEDAITLRTKAIIPVHLYGHPCDMDAILGIAGIYSLYVIEDCAEAHGAEYKDRKVGSFGDISCFSYFANKMITTGEGGMCLTNNTKLFNKMRILRDHGMSPQRRYWHDVVGFNYRMTNMQAAIGVAQMAKLDGFIEKKRQIAKWYAERLDGVSGIVLPNEMPWAKNVYWLYTILVEGRDELMEYLKSEGIDSRPAFYPINMMPPYLTEESFPEAERISRLGISLPSGVNLTNGEVSRVSSAVLKWMAQ